MSAPSKDHDLDRFVAFAFAAADILVEVRRDGRILYVVGPTIQFCGAEDRSVEGLGLEALISADDMPVVKLLLEDIAEGQRRGPIRITGAAGSTTADLRAFAALGDSLVHLTLGNLVLAQVTTERSRSSGLVNVQRFREVMEAEMASTRHGPGQPTLSLIKLNGLDAVGHDDPAIDGLLRTVGALLRLSSVTGDAAGELDRDRFAVVHDRRVSGEELSARIEALVDRSPMAGCITVERQSISLCQSSLTTEESLQAIAYVVSGFAKRTLEVGQVESLGQALTDSLASTARRISDVRQTIDDGAFDLVYQPIVSLADRKVHHFEALSRFRGDQTPASVITFAEEVGLIVDFDLVAIGKVIDYLNELTAGGQRATIAVNFSARSLGSDQFVEAIRARCRSLGKSAAQLCFEVTETVEILDLQRMNRVIQSLREAGHKVCLDDFGAGAAAFHYLRTLEVDYVKLDGAYVRRILIDDRDASILAGMVSMCQSLKVTTIAEMVETEEQASQLRSLGIDYAQGWLFGRPAPAILPSPIARSKPSIPISGFRRATDLWWRGISAGTS